MSEKNTLGVPTLQPLRLPGDPSIQEVVAAMNAQQKQTEFWLRQIANMVDTQSGARGNPVFLKNIDIQGNRLRNLGMPESDSDAQRVDLALGRKDNTSDYDAKGKKILNVASGDNPDHGVNLGQVLAALNQRLLQLLPLGVILLWSGAVASVPNGWQLCDGTGGTPDLRDRFIVGAGSTYAPGDTGGAAAINLAHTHSADGTLATDVDASAPSATTTVDNDLAASTIAVASATHTHSHSHDVTGDTNSALSAAQSILNPYYALAYIQRVS